MFEDSHKFVENLNISFQSYQSILETVAIKCVESRGRDLRVEGREKRSTQLKFNGHIIENQ